MTINEDILRDINRRIDDLLEHGRRIVDDEEIVERVERLRAQSEDYIRTNPLKSVVVGLVSGYLIGKIFSSEE